MLDTHRKSGHKGIENSSRESDSVPFHRSHVVGSVTGTCSVLPSQRYLQYDSRLSKGHSRACTDEFTQGKRPKRRDIGREEVPVPMLQRAYLAEWALRLDLQPRVKAVGVKVVAARKNLDLTRSSKRDGHRQRRQGQGYLKWGGWGDKAYTISALVWCKSFKVSDAQNCFSQAESRSECDTPTRLLFAPNNNSIAQILVSPTIETDDDLILIAR